MSFLLNPYRMAAGGGGGAPLKTITYSHTDYGGSTDLTNFQLFVWTTDAALKTVANGGSVANANHIRLASDSAGTTLLNWRVIHYDATTGLWVAVFKCASFSHTADTVVYLLSDDNGVTTFQGGTASNIWDSNYKAVHLFGDGTTLDLTDETSNADTLTNQNSVTATAGLNGLGGAHCDNSGPGMLDGANIINIAQPTFEYLVYPQGVGRIGGIVETNNIGTADKTTILNGSQKLLFYCYDGGTKNLTGATTLSLNTWYFVATLADGTNMKIFLNGTQDASQACGNTFAGYTHAGWRIGGFDGGGTVGSSSTNNFSFAALSNIARSADWIKARSQNFLSGSFFTVT